jgi:phosphoribosyl-AMP cyclohydrolase
VRLLDEDGTVTDIEQSISELNYSAEGLIPAICVDEQTRQVLMLGYMNEAALRRTIATGKTHFWSRSRQRLWMKGESSGHTQNVKAIYTDCDRDALVIEVVQRGGACHDGYYSCFYRKLGDAGAWEVAARRVFDPKKVYGDSPQGGGPRDGGQQA